MALAQQGRIKHAIKRVKFEDIKFGQTNVWKNRKNYSGEELMDLVCDVFPGSWLPYGSEGMIEPAKEHFKLVHIDSGRLDYIETIHRIHDGEIGNVLAAHVYGNQGGLWN